MATIQQNDSDSTVDSSIKEPERMATQVANGPGRNKARSLRSTSSHGSGNFVPYPVQSSHGSNSPQLRPRADQLLDTVEEEVWVSLDHTPGRVAHGFWKRLDEFFYSTDIISEAMRRVFPLFMVSCLASYLYLRAFTKERSALRGLIAILDKYPWTRAMIKLFFASFGGWLTVKSLYKEVRIWMGVDPPPIRKSMLDDFNTGDLDVIQQGSSAEDTPDRVD